MLKFFALAIAIFSFYSALSLFLSKRRVENVIYVASFRRANSFKEMLRFLIIGIAIIGITFFFLSRLGINVSGIVQNLFAFLTIIRSLLPF